MKGTNMKSLSIFGAALAVAITATMPAYAMDNMKMSMEKHTATQEISGTGTVVSANPKAGSAILKHEPIPALGWPRMTMQFKVKNKAQLDTLKKGDKVEFQLEQSGQDYMISNIQAK
jgi:Cu(I)/Ag(I) efflux system protein CusF